MLWRNRPVTTRAPNCSQGSASPYAHTKQDPHVRNTELDALPYLSAPVSAIG